MRRRRLARAQGFDGKGQHTLLLLGFGRSVPLALLGGRIRSEQGSLPARGLAVRIGLDGRQRRMLKGSRKAERPLHVGKRLRVNLHGEAHVIRVPSIVHGSCGKRGWYLSG